MNVKIEVEKRGLNLGSVGFLGNILVFSKNSLPSEYNGGVACQA